MFPVTASLDLLVPLVCERRKHANRAAVLASIRDHAALRDSAKSMGVFSRQLAVIRIQREDGLDRGVGGSPHEGLGPKILRRGASPLDVTASREERTLRQEHTSTQRKEEN